MRAGADCRQPSGGAFERGAGPERRALRPGPLPRLRVRRAHRLPGRPRAGAAAPRRRRRSRPPCGSAPSTACRSSPAAPAPASPAARCRSRDGVVIALARLKRVLEVDPVEPARRRRAGRDQPGDHRGGRAARALLRARPVQPAGLHDRRQRRRELRRRALPEVRLHDQPRARRRGRAARRLGRARSARRRGEQRRPGPARACSSAPRARSASPRRSPCGCCAPRRRCARCWPPSRRSGRAGDAVSDIIAAGHRAGGGRDDGHPRDRGRRGGGPRRLPASTSAAALLVELDGPAAECDTQFEQVKEICAEHGCTRAAHRRLAPRSARDLEGPQGGVRRDGPDLADYFVQDGVVPRTRLAEVLRPDRASWATRPGCGSPTSSTPATATCTRWCSTSAAAGETERAEQLSGAIAELCVELGGSLSGRARHRHGQGVLDAEDVRRGRPGGDAPGALRLRPARALQPGQGVSHAAAVRRAPRALPAAPAGGGGGDRAAR